MVSCANNPARALSPRPATGLGVRGVSKQATGSSRFNNKNKKVQRALCTLFEETAYASSPFFSVKGWLASPSGRHERRKNNNSSILHPALARLKMQECRETPTLRKATPIKDRSTALCAVFGRHRMQGDLDALADELGTCQLQSALKNAPSTARTLLCAGPSGSPPAALAAVELMDS